METVPLDLVLTPHGSLVLVEKSDAPTLDAALAQRLQDSFDRGPGHGLLRLGAAEAATALPPLYSYWREFGARYVTALCTQPDVEAGRVRLRVPRPPDEELEWMAMGAPPMVGAEYLTAAVLGALWQELDLAFGVELAESRCGVQDFLKRRNPAWNLVGRVHFNLAENRRDTEAPFAFLATYTTRLPLAKEGPARSRVLGREDLSDIFGLEMAPGTDTDAMRSAIAGAKPKTQKAQASKRAAVASAGQGTPGKPRRSNQRRRANPSPRP